MSGSLCASWWGGKRMKWVCFSETLKFLSWELGSHVSFCSKWPSLFELFLPIAELNHFICICCKTKVTAMHLSKCLFFLGVARAICLAPFNRTFPSLISSLNGQCHPNLLLLQAIFVKLLIAAYAKLGISLSFNLKCCTFGWGETAALRRLWLCRCLEVGTNSARLYCELARYEPSQSCVVTCGTKIKQ